MPQRRSLLWVLFCLFAWPASSHADERGIRLSDESITKWRFGVTLKAANSPASGIRATLPVPMDWAEQSVKKIDEHKSSNVGAITYSVLEGGVKQMIVTVPRLPHGDEASAIVTFEIRKRRIDAPADTAVYQIPKPAAALAKFLQPSPYIESNDPKIKSLAAQLAGSKEPAWDQTAAIFDWVRANVKYVFAEQIKPATASLKDGQGDCEELSSLVVAICRASKIPARAVWVPGHTYPEFCLADEQGKPHWFPCQAAGDDRQFGSMNDVRPILQKGDNFTIGSEKKRYVAQTLSAKDAPATPEYKFIMERVKDEN